MKAVTSSTFFSPWLAWLEMGQIPGHVVWHSSGRKLRSLAELPADYARRAEAKNPGALQKSP